MNHCMIDLETLDTKHTSVVLSLGVTVFDAAGILECGYWVFSRGEYNTRPEFTISTDTVSWWMNQTEEARRVFREPVSPVIESLAEFCRLYAKHNCQTIWANGVTFDIPILEHLFSQFKMVAPWKYNAVRDYRTVRQTYPDIPTPQVEGFIAHHAMWDAVSQTKHLIDITNNTSMTLR